MSDTTLGFPEAARRLGVPLRVLRQAIRSGKIPAPPNQAATASLPAVWLESAEEVVKASPKVLNRSFSQKVAPFARYEGTSAWRKYSNRVREYAHFRAKAEA
jgi:hypothetical protein